MKVLIVIDSLASGGAQKLKLELARGLVKKGHGVELFIYDSNYQFFESEFIKAGIKIHVSERKSIGFSLKVLKELRTLLKVGKYDGILSSLHAPSIYAAFSKIGIRGPKLIVCEESSSKAPVSFFKKVFFYFATIIADYIVANSFAEAKELKKLPLRSGKIKTIWNGLDLDLIPFSPNFRVHEENIKNLLVIGRVAYPKNGLNIMKAIKLFLKRNGWAPNLNWVGRRDTDLRSLKDKKTGKIQKEMNEFLNENPDVASLWKWLGNVDDIFKQFKQADALLAASLYEGLPVVICEAMLTGCFVIASDVCDHPLLIDESKRGLLCDPQSPESICQAIEIFNDMKVEIRNETINEARKFAENNFNIEKMVSSYEFLLNKKSDILIN